MKEDFADVVKTFAKENRLIVVGKDAGTVVSDGKETYFNQTGNDGMATAGSGDVLAGIAGGMYAMCSKRRTAASMSVYIHGLCGDYAKSKKGERPLLARDISKALEKVMGEQTWKKLM